MNLRTECNRLEDSDIEPLSTEASLVSFDLVDASRFPMLDDAFISQPLCIRARTAYLLFQLDLAADDPPFTAGISGDDGTATGSGTLALPIFSSSVSGTITICKMWAKLRTLFCALPGQIFP
jgi:hypothetical protein